MKRITVTEVSGERGYTDYSVVIELESATLKAVVAPNKDLAIGLALAKHRGRVCGAESELRSLLDAAAALGVPGLEAIGQGVRHKLDWTRVFLRDWILPTFSTEGEFAETGPQFFAVKNSTDSLIAGIRR